MTQSTEQTTDQSADTSAAPEAAVPDARNGIDAAAQAGEPGSGEQGFADLVARVTEGDMSADTWILAWDTIGQPLLLAVVLILAVFFAAGLSSRLTRRVCVRAKVEETLARFLSGTIRYIVLIAGGITILGTLGIETTSFAAILAAAGFAIGMALSGTLGNVAAGIMLLFFRPFKVGQVVHTAGVTGTVDEIGLFTTSVDTFDKRRIIVPNGKIFNDTIENISHHPVRRVDVSVGTSYGADIDSARRVMLETAKGTTNVLADPEPVVYLSGLGSSSIDWAVRVWVNAENFWSVKDELTRNTKYALDEAGISIPFPQMDVHIDGSIKD